MNRLVIYSLISFFLILTSCSINTYMYEGTEYRVYTELPKDAGVVKALDLSNNSGLVSDKIFELQGLVYLNLSNKGLLELSSKICHRPSLRVLILNENENIELPSCLYDMNSLEILSVIDCKYDKIPDGFYSMDNLKKLAIMANQFTEEELKLLEDSLPDTKVIAHLDL